MEFEIWLYRGLLTVLIILIFFLLRRWINRIDGKFDELIKAVKELALDGVKHAEQIKFINDRLKNGETRLNDHSSRLRCLETKSRKCSDG